MIYLRYWSFNFTFIISILCISSILSIFKQKRMLFGRWNNRFVFIISMWKGSLVYSSFNVVAVLFPYGGCNNCSLVLNKMDLTLVVIKVVTRYIS